MPVGGVGGRTPRREPLPPRSRGRLEALLEKIWRVVEIGSRVRATEGLAEVPEHHERIRGSGGDHACGGSDRQIGAGRHRSVELITTR